MSQSEKKTSQTETQSAKVPAGNAEAKPPKVERLADGVIIRLEEPLVFRRSKLDETDTVIEQLRLPNKVKGKHLKALDSVEGEVSKSLALLAKLAGLPYAALDELDSVDYEAATEVIESFLPQRRSTGKH